MTHHPLSNLLRALMVTTVLAALTTPTVAFAEGSAGGQAADAFERYAAAHPYGANSVTPTADVFERYAAAHTQPALTDRRSPDTRDVADVSQITTLANETTATRRQTLTRHNRQRNPRQQRPSDPGHDSHPPRPARQLRLGRRRHRRNRRRPHPRTAGRLNAAPTATTSPPPTCPHHIAPTVATGRAGRVSTRPAHPRSWTGSSTRSSSSTRDRRHRRHILGRRGPQLR